MSVIQSIEVVMKNGNKLVMDAPSLYSFAGFEPAMLICISYLSDDADSYIDDDGEVISGWNCNNSEYYLATNAELAKIAFMSRMCQFDGGFKASNYAKPLDYWLSKKK